MQSQQRQGETIINTPVRLAPEIILHILTYLRSSSRSSTLLPIITVCKQWARLALELIYEQPIVDLQNLESFYHTLTLQDQLENGQSPFWDTNSCSTLTTLNLKQEANLGINYRSMIKKPCRIVGVDSPRKQDHLVVLWDLQSLLWKNNIFEPIKLSDPLTVKLNLADSQSVVSMQSLPSPSSLSSSSSSSSSSSPLSSPTFQSPVQFSTPGQPDSKPISSSAEISPRRSISPSTAKPVLVRQKKKPILTDGPVVMLLDIPQVITDITCQILSKVPGMKLRCLHYRYRLTSAPEDLLKNNISSIQEIIFTRPFIRRDEFMSMAQSLGQANINTVKLHGCQYAGSSVLQQIAESCAKSLRNLEFRQFVSIRPMGDHAFFPIDGPRDWDLFSSATSKTQDLTSDKQGDGSRSPSSSSPIRTCPHIVPSVTTVSSASMDDVVENLSISNESAVAVPPPSPQTSVIPPNIDPEARMDLAIKGFGQHCRKLSSLRLSNLTYLTDDALSDFKPQLTHDSQQVYYGLSEIEIVESYFGSRMTLEGLIDICGPNLESLTVDRKSCWRSRCDSNEQKLTMCSACLNQDEIRRASFISAMPSGDRIIMGLIQKGGNNLKGPSSPSKSIGAIRRLDTLILIEHWVSIDILKKAIDYWWSTLKSLNIRLLKCSMEDLKEAFIDCHDYIDRVAGLENLVLGLPWLDDGSQETVDFGFELFKKYPRLETVRINKQTLDRKRPEI